MNTQQILLEKRVKSAKKAFLVLGSISLLLAPLLSFIGWAIAHDSLASFLNFNFTWEATDGTTLLTATSSAEQIDRYYLLPHYHIYASMPVYIGLSLCLAVVLFKKKPWHALVGAVLSIIGAVYFIGVLGAFLSIPMGTVNVTGILLVSFALCILVFIGNIVLGFGLFSARIIPRWASLLFISGNVLILLFSGVENWMALGSLLLFVGMLPLSIHLFHQRTIPGAR